MPDLGVTGTQSGLTREQRNAMHGFLTGFFTSNPTGRLHHGDCVGADAEAHEFVEQLGIDIVIHPPRRSEKRAFKHASTIREPREYLDRNHDIVDECVTLLVLPHEEHEVLRSGTWATYRYAKKCGREIFIIGPGGACRIG